MENALDIVRDFGKNAGLELNVKKTKAIWLGRWANSETNSPPPTEVHSPVKILGVHFSYDKKSNGELKVLRKLQTKLDMGSGDT